MAQDIIIAIDGFASSGKSTIASQVATALHYSYVDSGAFYRAVTLYFLERNINVDDINSIDKALNEITITFGHNNNLQEVLLNGRNAEREIRGIEVSNAVSRISAVPHVRFFISEMLRKLGTKKRIVMDGRDIGTVVFPEAELKIYLTANDRVRRERRFSEMLKNGEDITEKSVSDNLMQRDLLDSTRATAPLKKADDAIAIDNTHLSLQEQFEVVLQLAKSKINH